MPRSIRISLVFSLALAAGGAAQQGTDLDHGLASLVNDYTALYRQDTFDQWRTLFLPNFTVGSTTADGGRSARTLEQFLTAQERGFGQSRQMGERLENVRTERRGRLASVWADFVFWQDADSTRGRLVLLAIADQSGWKFQSLLFSYHD